VTGGRVPDVARIAVLRAADGLGDYLLTVPALAALKAAYPDAELWLLGLDWHATFLTGRPGPVDQVVVLPRVPGVSAPPDAAVDAAEVDRFVGWLRDQRLDLALQLHGGGRYSNPFLSRLGARVTAGLRAPDAPPLDRWVRYVHYQPEAVRYLEAAALVGAEPVGLVGGVVPHLVLTDADRAEAAAVLGGEPPPGGLVALHPGARDLRRRWPPERFAAVGDALAGAGRTVLVTGSGGEREVVERVVAGMWHPARPLVDALSLGGLAALYAACRLLVANDTGPRLPHRGGVLDRQPDQLRTAGARPAPAADLLDRVLPGVRGGRGAPAVPRADRRAGLPARGAVRHRCRRRGDDRRLRGPARLTGLSWPAGPRPASGGVPPAPGTPARC
jgi:ADP-heptose:LPS heptosyltransferase